MKLYARGALDPRWTRHHTPTVTDFMLATVKVLRNTVGGAPAEYDQVTRKWSDNASHVVAQGLKARVQPYGIIGNLVVGQDTTGRRLIRVQIESVETGIHVDDIIVLTDCPDNPELTYYALEVRGVIASSNAWHTELVCELDIKANTPTPPLGP